MTPAEFRALRRQLGLSQGGLARVLQVASDRTVRKWEAGERDIPGPAQVLVRLLTECPAARRWLERELTKNNG